MSAANFLTERAVKKIISFSVYGDHPMYRVGALENVRLAARWYPGWTCRFYVSQEIPLACIEQLQAGNAEVVRKARKKHIDGMFWRFLPVDDDDVDALVVRDSDSRITEREALAVQEWGDNGAGFHIMRDHPLHQSLILGGLWGVRGECLHRMKQMIELWRWMRMLTGKGSFYRKGLDQDFLSQMVYPLIAHNVIIHSDLVRFEGERVTPFPTLRKHHEFVGQTVNERNTPLAEEVTALKEDSGQLKTYRRPRSFLSILLAYRPMRTLITSRLLGKKSSHD